jgi:hypothetical protein
MFLVFFAKLHHLSVIVHNCHIHCLRADPTETDPPLIVNPDAVSSTPIPSKRFKTIPRNRTQIGKRDSRVQVV